MPSVSRIAFTILGQPIYWYGLLIAAGVVLGAELALLRGKKSDLPKDTVLDLMLIVIPVALVCARLYYVAFAWDQYRDNLWSVFNMRLGGMAVYGSIIGGIVAGFFFCRRKKLSFATLADLIIPSVPLGQAIGRWGNFFNQEAYGAVVTNPSLQFFPAAVYIEAQGQWHYAAFFYESLWCFIVLAILLIAERKRGFKHKGDLFVWYIVLYAAERAIVEGLRIDSLYWGSVRVSQLLSLLGFAAACLFLFIRAARKRRPGAQGMVWLCAVLAALATAAVPVGAFIAAWQVAAVLVALIAAVPLYRQCTLASPIIREGMNP